jgi:hypothetical protein
MFRLDSVFELSSLLRSLYEKCSVGDVTTTQIVSLIGQELRTVRELRTGHGTYDNTCTGRISIAGISSVGFVEWQRELRGKLYMNVNH